MTQSTPDSPTPETTSAPPPAATDIPPPAPDAGKANPPVPSALFRALVDAGADAELAYTADRQAGTMIESILAAQLQPLAARMDRLFDAQERRFDAQLQPLAARMDHLFDEQNRRFDEQDRRFDEQARKLAEHDRKLDVLAAQMRLLLGGFGLLITALIAVFGILFAR